MRGICDRCHQEEPLTHVSGSWYCADCLKWSPTRGWIGCCKQCISPDECEQRQWSTTHCVYCKGTEKLQRRPYDPLFPNSVVMICEVCGPDMKKFWDQNIDE